MLKLISEDDKNRWCAKREQWVHWEACRNRAYHKNEKACLKCFNEFLQLKLPLSLKKTHARR